ncbi:hypothetical protein Tco_0206035, partial [Tanacetum coccineum]
TSIAELEAERKDPDETIVLIEQQLVHDRGQFSQDLKSIETDYRRSKQVSLGHLKLHYPLNYDMSLPLHA